MAGDGRSRRGERGSELQQHSAEHTRCVRCGRRSDHVPAGAAQGVHQPVPRRCRRGRRLRARPMQHHGRSGRVQRGALVRRRPRPATAWAAARARDRGCSGASRATPPCPQAQETPASRAPTAARRRARTLRRCSRTSLARAPRPLVKDKPATGDWSDTANAQSCSPCEPGATCLRNAGDNIGRCVRRCEQRSDCPCGNFECFSSGSPASNSASFCSTCAPSRASCLMAGGGGDQAPTTGPCCDKGGAVCNASTNFTCCRPRGTSCESNGQCCEGNVCFAGACGVCRGAGQSAANASQCCAGLELRNGVCSVRCPAMGASCTVPGQQGRCNRGTVTACNAFGAITCTSIGPIAETCNGQDDNCDGSIDNIAPRACTMPTRFETSNGTAVCNVGRPSAGVERCVAGASVCTAIEGFHFCRQAGTRSVEDPLNPGTFVTRDCGGGFGSACMCATAGGCGPSNPQATTCAPSLYCASSAQSGGGSPSCQPLPLCVGRNDLCWAPSTTRPATYTPLPACI
jgi:hypothetical protein